jgi:choloylglycine hydrolase
MNTDTYEYFFKTYDNSQIGTARLREHHKYCAQPICLGKLERPVSFETIQKSNKLNLT